MKCSPRQVIKIALGKLCLIATAAVRAIFFFSFLFSCLLPPLPAHLANLEELKYANGSFFIRGGCSIFWVPLNYAKHPGMSPNALLTVRRRLYD